MQDYLYNEQHNETFERHVLNRIPSCIHWVQIKVTFVWDILEIRITILIVEPVQFKSTKEQILILFLKRQTYISVVFLHSLKRERSSGLEYIFIHGMPLKSDSAQEINWEPVIIKKKIILYVL